MKTVFYDRNGMVGIIDSVGKNGYVLDVSKNDGENYINKKWLYGQKMVHQLKTLDHQMKTKAEVSDEEMGELIKRFPWFAGHEAETKGVLRGFLSGLLLYAIREGQKDLADMILKECRMDEKGLSQREIREAKKIRAEELLDEETMVVELKCADGKSFSGAWKRGSCYISRNENGRRVSADMVRQLDLRFCELKALQRNCLEKESGYLHVKLPGLERAIAFRPWEDSRPGEKQYEFAILQEESPVLSRKVLDAPSFLRYFAFRGRTDTEQADRETAENYAGRIMETAAAGGDRYMELAVKSYLGKATEDECEFLFREDGKPHFIPGSMKRRIEKLEILDGRPGWRSFFSYRKRFFFRVKVDGYETEICWFPDDPGHFRMEVYHHVEDCVLSEEQVEYVQKVTERMMP